MTKNVKDGYQPINGTVEGKRVPPQGGSATNFIKSGIMADYPLPWEENKNTNAQVIELLAKTSNIEMARLKAENRQLLKEVDNLNDKLDEVTKEYNSLNLMYMYDIRYD